MARSHAPLPVLPAGTTRLRLVTGDPVPVGEWRVRVTVDGVVAVSKAPDEGTAWALARAASTEWPTATVDVLRWR